MNQQSRLLRISELLSRFSAQSSILNSNGEYSINIHSENILIKVLNELYDLDLENINYTEGKTAPGIDLGDRKRRVAIQITATPDISKILKTIHQFNDKKLYEKYDQLYIYVITQKRSSYSQQKIAQAVNGNFIFTADHIIDHKDVYKALNERNELDIINRICYLLEQQFSDNLQGFQNPYAGLPDLERTRLPMSPYISLRPYRAEETSTFWGRGRQIKALYDAVLDTRNNPVLLLYGQTGVGKSSLLEAGLLPRLKTRANVCHKSRAADLGLPYTLDMALGASAQQANNQKTILIIDQLEEAWTNPIKELPNEIEMFFTHLKNLFTSPQHSEIKVILGYRKEYHAEVEELCIRYNIPVMPFFLQPIDRDGIKEVVNGCLLTPAARAQYQLQIEAGLDEQIANDLCADPESPVMPVLQILMTNLWEGVRYLPPEKRILTHHAYRQLKKTGYTLYHFLDAKLDKIRQTHSAALESGLVIDLLFFFTTSLSTSSSHSKEDVINRYEEDLPIQQLINSCVNHYLLTESRETMGSYSLAHDTLAPIVRARFESSIFPGQKANRILHNHCTDIANNDFRSMSTSDFATAINGRKGMRKWTKAEIAFVKESGYQSLENDNHKDTLRILGEDLHDEIGSFLSICKLNLMAALRSEVPKEQHEMIQSTTELLDQIIQILRDLLTNINITSASFRNSYLRYIKLSQLTQSFTERINKFYTIEWNTSGEDRELADNEKIAIYRVFQEAINNIIKHANAKKIHVDFKSTDADLSIRIEDDGRGFDLNNTSGEGQGLKNMKYRMFCIEGHLSISSKPGNGCVVSIALPLKSQEGINSYS